MQTINWGIIGPGRIANKFVKGLAVAPGAVCLAVASRELSRAQAFAAEYGIAKAYGSYKELAADPQIDIVYIATPHPQHEAAALLCLEHGKAVLCEKPMAANLAQATRMATLAREKKLLLMEAVWTRTLPSTVKALELIAEGAIGEVRRLEASFAFNAPFNPEGRLFNPDAAGGALLDVGCYNLSLAHWVFGGEPSRVQAHMAIGESGVDEETSIQLSYPDGRSAQLFCAVRLSTKHDARVYGRSGYIELPSYWNGAQVVLNNTEGKQVFDLPYEATGYQFEAMEAMRCLREGLTESPLLPLDATLSVIKTMDGVRSACGLAYPFEKEV
ncbi:MAG: Gfo/Idh/MocA family oxidoreductase [Clostridia bacterium]|nr:Gfo/Idh/MocA family oxidoreductase [Clostridia bacterium]